MQCYYRATRFIVGAIVSLLWNIAAAQQPLVQFDRIEGANSFSNNGINAIAQDQQGFLWFGSFGDGIARYDGYEFRVFRHERNNPSSLSHNDVHHINVAPDGTIWVATANGLNEYDAVTESFKRHSFDPEGRTGLSSDHVENSLVDGSGTLWVGTDAGLDRRDAGQSGFRHYALAPDDPSGIGPGRAFGLFLDRDNTLWVGTLGGGLLRYERATDSFVRFMHEPEDPTSISDNNIRDIIEDRSGNLWIATDRGLNRMDRGSDTFRRYLPEEGNPASLRGNHVGHLLEDSLGNFWVSQDRLGVALFDREAGTFLHFDHDPADSGSLGVGRVWTIFEDSGGVVWLGTNVINRVAPMTHAFRGYENPYLTDSEAGDLPSLIVKSGDGAIWTDSIRGIDRFDTNSKAWQRFALMPEDPGSGHNEAMAIHEDREGNLWVAYPRFLSRVDGSTGEHTSVPLESRPLCAYRDTSGRMWLCMPFHGFVQIDLTTGEERQVFADNPEDPQSITHTFAYFAFEDSAGRFWIGTVRGLNRFDPELGTFERFVPDEADATSISHANVTAWFEDGNGMVWFGTDSGLNRYNPASDDFTVYYNGPGSAANRISAIAQGDGGRLWLSHGEGLAEFDPSTGRFRNLTSVDGLPPVFGAPMLRNDVDGLLYIATAEGLAAFDATRTRETRNALNVALTDFRLFNEPVAINPADSSTPLQLSITQADQVTLGPDDSMLSLGFAALDFADPTSIRYSYRLEGFDDDWVDTTSDRRIATYTEVPAGTYTFRVRAATSEGTWSGNEAALTLTILPHWWETTWARVAYVAIALGLLFAIVQLRTRALRIQGVRLEQTVDERTRELRTQKHTIERQAKQLEEVVATKDRYFTEVSHEFRTPLTVILAPIQRLLGQASDIEFRNYLQTVQRNASRLLRLVDRLLGLAKLDTERPDAATAYHVASTISSITNAMRALASEKSITIEETVPDDVWLQCAGGALEEILINLLSNAIKYTPAGGEIGISAVPDASGMVSLTVRDSGPGIPETEQANVFDRFYRVDGHDTSVAGSGLGLALVHELTLASNGKVNLTSSPGQGTAVQIRLPRCDAPRDSEHLPAASARTAFGADTEVASLMPTQTLRELPIDDSLPNILVIEDNVDMCRNIQDLLRGSMNCAFAHDGSTGVDNATDQIPDIVICDVALPKINGFEVTRRLKHDDRTCHIPVIMLTARADDESRLQGLQALADDYVTKPFDEHELLQRIDTVLAIREILRNRYAREIHETGGAAMSESLSEKDRRFMERVDQSLSKHYQDASFSTAQLADAAAMSERQLQRKFRALMNLAPREYLRNYRLNRARKLLLDGKSVSDTAFAVGFSSLSYFGKCFRAQYGKAPSDVFRADSESQASGESA